MTKTIDALVEALELAMKYAAPAMALDKQSPSNAQWMVEAVMQQETFIKEALARARAEQAEPVAWRISDPEEPEIGHWYSEEPSDLSFHKTEPLYTTPPAAPVASAEQAEPVYQYQLANGSWIDQTKTSHDYNVKHEQAAVRVLYTAPPAAPVAKLEPLSDAEIDAEFFYSDSPKISPIQRARIFARAIEAAHNAKLGGAG